MTRLLRNTVSFRQDPQSRNGDDGAGGDGGGGDDGGGQRDSNPRGETLVLPGSNERSSVSKTVSTRTDS